MPPVIPNPAAIHSFATEADFERWMSKNHATASEVWIRIQKKGSGTPGIKINEALDVVLCWGWIDAIRKSLDATTFLQRYTPRTKKSIWSLINTDHVARLAKAKRMQAPGQAQIDAAKSDGRWEKAYGGAKIMTPPDDLMAAIDANKKARVMFDTLTSQNRYALSFRLMNIKTDVARTRNIEAFVAMLARGETFYPNGAPKKPIAKVEPSTTKTVTGKTRAAAKESATRSATKSAKKSVKKPTTKSAKKNSSHP